LGVAIFGAVTAATGDFAALLMSMTFGAIVLDRADGNGGVAKMLSGASRQAAPPKRIAKPAPPRRMSRSRWVMRTAVRPRNQLSGEILEIDVSGQDDSAMPHVAGDLFRGSPDQASAASFQRSVRENSAPNRVSAFIQ
jgi:hypothetical protein